MATQLYDAADLKISVDGREVLAGWVEKAELRMAPPIEMKVIFKKMEITGYIDPEDLTFPSNFKRERKKFVKAWKKEFMPDKRQLRSRMRRFKREYTMMLSHAIATWAHPDMGKPWSFELVRTAEGASI